MRPWIAAISLTAVLAVSLAAAPSSTTEGPKTRPRPFTVRGEILDLSCYLARGLSGPLHRDCARKCLMSGVPMGIMGPDSTVYLLTPDHGRAMTPQSYTGPDPYVQCRDWASLTVEVVGPAFVRNGVRIVEVARAKIIPAAGSPPGATR